MPRDTHLSTIGRLHMFCRTCMWCSDHDSFHLSYGSRYISLSLLLSRLCLQSPNVFLKLNIFNVLLFIKNGQNFLIKRIILAFLIDHDKASHFTYFTRMYKIAFLSLRTNKPETIFLYYINVFNVFIIFCWYSIQYLFLLNSAYYSCSYILC